MENKIMENQIKYTFLLPAYKPDFFEEALRSIKNQTYSDFNVLVSDDCSPHDLKSIYDDVCGDDARFSYRRNEVNMGSKSLVSHWNLLVDMCDTEYFILASDDDVYEPIFLEEVDKLARKYPKVDLIRARVKKINEKGDVLFQDVPLQEKVAQVEFTSQIFYNNVIQCIANYVFKKEILKSFGGFVDFPLAWFSDTATVLNMSNHSVVNTKDILFCFRHSTQNISFRGETKKTNYKKALAATLFRTWFSKYMDVLNTHKNLSVSDSYLIPLIKRNSKIYIDWMVLVYIRGCKLTDFCRLVLKQPEVILKFESLYLFLRSYIHFR